MEPAFQQPLSDGVSKSSRDATRGLGIIANEDLPSAPEKFPETTDAEQGRIPERSRAKITLIMLALGLAAFLAALDIAIVTTALPTISEHFQSDSVYTWVGSAFLLTQAASTPIWGKISDIFGRKPVILLANAIFFIGSLVSALAVSAAMLITGRAIQGLGGGGLFVMVNICIGDMFSPRERGAYYGMIGGAWALASSLGPVVGGAFVQNIGWRWCFYLNLPIDGVAFVVLLLFLDLETPRTPLLAGLEAIDWLGSMLIVSGTVMLLLGLQYGGQQYPWGSAIVVCLIIFGVFVLVLFFLHEFRTCKSPIIPTRIFRRRSNLASLGVCFIQSYVFIAGAYYLPLYFQEGLGRTPIISGVYTLGTSAALCTASIVSGISIRRTGRYLAVIIAGMVVMTAGNGLYIDFDASSSLVKIILYQVIVGLGVGPNFQAPLIALQSGINPRDLAPATAAFGFTRNLATSISIAIAHVVFQNDIKSQWATLETRLGAKLASETVDGSISSKTQGINQLSPQSQHLVRTAITDGLSTMWIMYTCVAFAGIFVSACITENKLSSEHEETQTGLAVEEDDN